jgi:hypothetical protein
VSLTELPTGTPSTSNLNFPAGDTRANGITSPMAANGTVALVHLGTGGATTDLILDVTGYFE